MKDSEQYIEILNAKIEQRIEEMESQEYSFPERFNKKNYLIWGATVILCLLAVFLGAWL